MFKNSSESTDARKRNKKQNEGEIESLKELADLLKVETDRWSRQVILAEAAMKFAELEKQLAKKRAS